MATLYEYITILHLVFTFENNDIHIILQMVDKTHSSVLMYYSTCSRVIALTVHKKRTVKKIYTSGMILRNARLVG